MNKILNNTPPICLKQPSLIDFKWINKRGRTATTNRNGLDAKGEKNGSKKRRKAQEVRSALPTGSAKSGKEEGMKEFISAIFQAAGLLLFALTIITLCAGLNPA